MEVGREDVLIGAARDAGILSEALAAATATRGATLEPAPAREACFNRRDMDDERRRHCTRIADGLRGLIEGAIRLDAPAAELAGLADEVERLARSFAGHRGERMFPPYNPPREDDLDPILPYSPVSGRYNALAAPVAFRRDGERVIGEVTFGLAYEGPPRCVHGSVIASVYDQLLAFASIATRRPGPTASLTIEFRRLTPLFVPLRYEAWVDRVDGRKTFAAGRCLAGGEVVSQAAGIFIGKPTAGAPTADGL
jgi:hypothetical protein